jgi:hypothetical protein
MKYKSVIVTRRSGPEVLQVVENDLHPPADGEALIKILATPVVRNDFWVAMRGMGVPLPISLWALRVHNRKTTPTTIRMAAMMALARGYGKVGK